MSRVGGAPSRGLVHGALLSEESAQKAHLLKRSFSEAFHLWKHACTFYLARLYRPLEAPPADLLRTTRAIQNRSFELKIQTMPTPKFRLYRRFLRELEALNSANVCAAPTRVLRDAKKLIALLQHAPLNREHLETAVQDHASTPTYSKKYDHAIKFLQLATQLAKEPRGR